MEGKMTLETLIAVARGEEPADLLLKNAQLVNVLSGEIHPADIAIYDGQVVGWGEYQARQVVDLGGKFVCPGFIDAHVHLESSMVQPAEFARAVAPHGTTAVVCDPHEIANVLGLAGVRYILDASAGLPLYVYVMAPSCVPATHMETAGAELTAADIEAILAHDRVLGLAEMMNYPGVLFRVPAVLAKIKIAGDRPVDGHAPGLSGLDLNAYIAAGIRSDHECTTADEAREKLRRGMHIFIREGTTARNLHPLLPLVTPANARLCHFCTDDRHPDTLLREGHVDDLVRKAIAWGLDPLTAMQMASINTAAYLCLRGVGAVAPGYRADLLVLDNLQTVQVAQVYAAGRLVAERGRFLLSLADLPRVPIQPSVHVEASALDFAIPAGEGPARHPRPGRHRGPAPGTHHRRRPRRLRSDPRPAQDRCGRAAPRHRPRGPGPGAGRRAETGRYRLQRRPRFAQYRRDWRRRGRHAGRRRRRRRHGRRPGGRRRWAGPRRLPAAHRRPDVRPAPGRGPRPGRCPDRGGPRPGLHPARSTHDHELPGVAGHPGPQAHRQGTGRRGQV
jgi:hypothetical protein